MNHVSDLTEVGLHSVKFTLNNNNYRNEYRVAVIGSTHVSIQNKFNCMNCFQILCIASNHGNHTVLIYCSKFDLTHLLHQETNLHFRNCLLQFSCYAMAKVVNKQNTDKLHWFLCDPSLWLEWHIETEIGSSP